MDEARTAIRETGKNVGSRRCWLNTDRVGRVRRNARLTRATRMVALLLTELGRRQRAGALPTVDGRYVHGISDDQCIDMLRQNYGS